MRPFYKSKVPALLLGWASKEKTVTIETLGVHLGALGRCCPSLRIPALPAHTLQQGAFTAESTPGIMLSNLCGLFLYTLGPATGDEKPRLTDLKPKA